MRKFGSQAILWKPSRGLGTETPLHVTQRGAVTNSSVSRN